jgi:hypothetical protein
MPPSIQRLLHPNNFPTANLALSSKALFIGKPFSIDALARKVREALDAPVAV